MSDSSTNPKRVRPNEKGENNDPFLRNNDASHPRINTISEQTNREDNEEISKVAADGFRTQDVNSDGEADKRFDEEEKEDI